MGRFLRCDKPPQIRVKYKEPETPDLKEILRRNIRAIDTAAEYSADAWNEYCLLKNFFKEHYNELWDNYED